MIRPPPRSTLFTYTTLFRSLLAASHYAGTDPFADGFVHLAADGAGGTQVLYDTDGPASGNTIQFVITTLDQDRKSTRLNSSHSQISYAVFCLKKKRHDTHHTAARRPEHSPEPAMSRDVFYLDYSCRRQRTVMHIYNESSISQLDVT